jgi:N-ethylmaleimide reductase
MDSADTDLFAPLMLGDMRLSNRIVMAPLTRARADLAGLQPALAADYYAQRATAGLIISEATNISPMGKGFEYTPGLFTAAQVDAWRAVTSAVHAKDGRIFCQLWHVGRMSHPSLLPGGRLPVAPSAIRPDAQAFTAKGRQQPPCPRPLDFAELPGVVTDYRRAAENARRAGFNGVELHAANGYLLDQFMRDRTNKRKDRYGGSVENRCRLTLEVVEGLCEIWPSNRVGVRVSPTSDESDMGDSDPAATFGYLATELSRFGLAYLHVVEGSTHGPRERDFDFLKLRRAFAGLYMANKDYDQASALASLRAGRADLIAFGRLFISNPDLVERMRIGAPIVEPDRDTYYGEFGARGYTDYPFLRRERLERTQGK